ncbi:hypothetical protein AOLI_G00167170 [Acnodon oligacanthus]
MYSEVNYLWKTKRPYSTEAARSPSQPAYVLTAELQHETFAHFDKACLKTQNPVSLQRDGRQPNLTRDYRKKELDLSSVEGDISSATSTLFVCLAPAEPRPAGSSIPHNLPRRRVNIFGEELERQLKQKYEGHWYPDKPYKGSGFRCIHVGEKVDPVVEQAAKESGLDIEDVRNNLPQDLSVWIDPFEVSYQIGEKGPVKVLYVDDSNENGLELDKEIKNSFNPEAQVFMPITEPMGPSPTSSSPSPPFGQSAAVSPTFMPRSTQPLTFTTATFAATKFGSTKMKSSGRNNNKVARSSPTNLGLNVNNLLKQKAISTSMHSLYGLGLGGQQQKTSALSPNAKEFVFPSLQGQGSPSAMFPGDSSLSLSSLQYNNAFDVFAAYGGLNEKSLMDGLNFSLSNMQYSNQQFQPVMAN